MTVTAVPNKNNNFLYAAGDIIVFCGEQNKGIPVTGFEDPLTLADTSYKCLGWIDVSGYLFKLDETTKDIAAAGTLSSIRTILTGGSKSVQFTCLEALNPYARSLFDDVPIFPDTASALKPATGTIAKYVIPDPPLDNRYSFIFDSVDGSKRQRLYAPNCKVTARGDDQTQQADIEQFQMTVTMYPGVIGANTAAVGQRFIDWGPVAGSAIATYFD